MLITHERYWIRNFNYCICGVKKMSTQVPKEVDGNTSFFGRKLLGSIAQVKILEMKKFQRALGLDPIEAPRNTVIRSIILFRGESHYFNPGAIFFSSTSLIIFGLILVNSVLLRHYPLFVRRSKLTQLHALIFLLSAKISEITNCLIWLLALFQVKT